MIIYSIKQSAETPLCISSWKIATSHAKHESYNIRKRSVGINSGVAIGLWCDSGYTSTATTSTCVPSCITWRIACRWDDRGTAGWCC